MIVYCSNTAGRASPYEEEEIVFLLTVAGVIRKEPLLLHLFLPSHEHTWAVASLNPSLGMKAPIKNTLFDAKLNPIVRKVSLIQDSVTNLSTTNDETLNQDSCKSLNEFSNAGCDCTENESFVLFDTILRYFDSAVSKMLFLYFN